MSEASAMAASRHEHDEKGGRVGRGETGRGGEPRAVYMISVAAELAGMHPQTLRIYERKGLLAPARTAGNTRRYSDADIARLKRIQELTAAGLNLAGVSMIMELESELARLRSELDETVDLLAAMQHRIVDEVAAAHQEHRRELVLRSPILPMPRERKGSRGS